MGRINDDYGPDLKKEDINIYFNIHINIEMSKENVLNKNEPDNICII